MQAGMRQMVHFVVVAAAWLLVFSSTAFVQSNPFIGTWKLNLAKSKYDPGPPPMSRTEVIETWEMDGVKVTITVVGAAGKSRATETSYHYDGKDQNITGGRNAFAAKRVDANTVLMKFKDGGKDIGRSKTVLSNNGKTMTVTLTGINTQGHKIHEVMVFDKQ
jgi:hypothetical protein